MAGDLGPGTIVGSAAFNLFIIIGLCVYVIPDKEVRKIKHLRVFFITATWSVFAYIWLYFILTWSSYGEVEVWEGLLTFIFFPATVGTAYVADRRLLFYKYLAKDYRLNRRGVVVEAEGHDKDDRAASIGGKEQFKRFASSRILLIVLSVGRILSLWTFCREDPSHCTLGGKDPSSLDFLPRGSFLSELSVEGILLIGLPQERIHFTGISGKRIFLKNLFLERIILI